MDPREIFLLERLRVLQNRLADELNGQSLIQVLLGRGFFVRPNAEEETQININITRGEIRQVQEELVRYRASRIYFGLRDFCGCGKFNNRQW